MKNIAVYWDFENIHSSLCTLRYGEDWLDQFRGQRHPTVVDIEAIMQFAESQGSVNINKAYGNWAWYQQYGPDLHQHTFDLVQLFPRGWHMKNGADIRLAIDALDDLNLHQHLDTFVIVGGDSDYISLAQRVRQRGKQIIGIGVKETTNKFWINACNDFHFYSSIANTGGQSGPAPQATGDIQEAKRLLWRAVSELQRHHGANAVRLDYVRPKITALDPYFDLDDYGWRNFDEFLNASSDCVETFDGDDGTNIRVLEGAATAVCHDEDCGAKVDLYRKVLAEKDMPLPRSGLLKPGLLHVVDIFLNKPEGIDYLDQVDKALSDYFLQAGLSHSTTDCYSIRQLIYRIRGFYIDHEANKRFLHYKNEDFLSLWESIVHRVLDALARADDDPVDFTALSMLINGDDSLSDELATLAARAEGQEWAIAAEE